MKQISNKEYEKYQQYLTDQLHGRTLTPDGLRIICASYDYDPDDHYSKLGMEMQRYLADQCTREQLAEAIQNYWANVTPVQH